MYPDTDLYKLLPWIMLIIGLPLSITLIWIKLRIKNKFHASIAIFKLMSIAVGAFLIMLWMLLPCTPVISTFGFPKTVGEIQSPENLLKLLQDYNKALVRTTEVLHWFIFVFVWWFLAGLNIFSTVLKVQLDAKQDKSSDKSTD
ncbi:MAG TPA: hypothetical protein VE344_10525 [Methylomirabilota bacterium]|nr:hypothetical protein [Methylomirabilota bacterium]